ncbi:hypothetical protein HanHA300_Chr02g0056601 [Helianthus annuus]|nr:hypothetical protein HanHA300_Chr02g0056601 [Helianthus annuus]KAJ0618893.1 hypothetical protein HanHA89_Chr02g0065141 [Helianthus annuus]
MINGSSFHGGDQSAAVERGSVHRAMTSFSEEVTLGKSVRSGFKICKTEFSELKLLVLRIGERFLG